MISGGAEDGGEKREPPPSHYYSPSYSGGEGNGNPLQYSSLENSIGRIPVAWQATVHGIEKSQTQLSN